MVYRRVSNLFDYSLHVLVPCDWHLDISMQSMHVWMVCIICLSACAFISCFEFSRVLVFVGFYEIYFSFSFFSVFSYWQLEFISWLFEMRFINWDLSPSHQPSWVGCGARMQDTVCLSWSVYGWVLAPATWAGCRVRVRYTIFLIVEGWFWIFDTSHMSGV